MWQELLENPQALSMFQPEPSLQSIAIIKMNADEDGPTVTFSLRMRDYPLSPPVKWSTSAYNAVVIELQALGVKSFRCEGWTTENVVDIGMRRLPDGELELATSGASLMTIRCGWIRVVGVHPYHRGSLESTKSRV